ncbi:hypothetical protein UA08_01177 [Talaromyces atroroseus]|uniref:Transcription factor domain-containing protein n=1 Tax=Talaromyces atroroseus TaxID=1441469 RepID=A0A1Q5Q9V2_TALAT|nr:hypothetical protein UA08_01177 [Talaromyces atroroseus]OKL62671.1 hypothetical protein UA08_01177 [Talaromyces atroroseus]
MRGKNARKRQKKLTFGSWINNLGEGALESVMSAKKEAQITLPHSVCSDLQTFSYPDRTQLYMLDLVYQFFAVLNQSLYPIEVCVAFDPAPSVYFEYLQRDALFLHSALWTAQSYFDCIQGFQVSERALFHECKAINQVQKRLNYPQTAVNDATIAVVVNFVLTTALVGHFSTAKKHMAGLYQLLKLRGGLRQLKGNSQLQIKICRADLSVALLNGDRPLLLSDSNNWKPFLADVADTEFLKRHFQSFTLDRRLANTGTDLRRFCDSANMAFITSSKIDGPLFQETLISVQYRLITLKFNENGDEKEGSLNEAFRLALLAFSTTVFLQLRGIKIRFSLLSAQLKDALLSQVVWADLRKMETVSLWVLFVAAIVAVTDEDDVWLVSLMNERLRGTESFISWHKVRSILKDFMWIGEIHDEDGKAVYSRMVRYAAVHKDSSSGIDVVLL